MIFSNAAGRHTMNRVLRVFVLAMFGLLATRGLTQEIVTPATPDTIKNLRESAANDRAQADGDQTRADTLRELAQKARRSAQSTRDAAQRASWIEDAKRREVNAKELEARVTRLRAAAAEKEARAVRLEAAYNKKYGQKAESPAPKRASSSDSPPAQEWMVEDLVGLWARASEPGFTLAIVPQLPDEPAMINRIEAHSDRRIWVGTFYNASREGPARGVLTYTPKPEEMNPAIPDWARRMVSGKLVWRLEITPAGDRFSPTLKAKWYRGKVSWKASEPASASVIGDGKPLEFAFESIDTINIESLSYPTVAIKLPNPAHDPNTDPVEALTKGQRFFVRVTLPVEIAREKGAKISATVRSLAGGGEEKLELTGAIGKGQRPVVYSHVDQVTIADCDITEPRRTPSFLSWDWILRRIRDYKTGECLNIKIKNEELVEIRYGDAAVQVPVYGSWVQRGIARHVEAAVRLREIYQSLLVGPYERGVKEAAHKRIRMLANYESLRGSDKLTDLHRYFVGEAYLGDAAPALLQTEDSTLSARYYDDVRNPPIRTDPTYFTPLVKAALEGLTGKDLSPKAWTAGKSIVWTSEAEQFYVLREIRRTSTRLAEDALKATYESFAFGLYDGIATATPAGGIYLLVSGKDHFGRPQPRWVRIMAAVSLASNAVLHLYGPTAATRFSERLSRRLPATSGKVTQTTLSARRTGSVSQAAGRAAPPRTPNSVQGAKREHLSLELSHDAPSNGGTISCAARSQAQPIVQSLSPTQGPLEDVMRTAVEQIEIHTYKNKHYGPQTTILDLDKPAVSERQRYKNCQQMAVDDGIHEATQARPSQDHGAAMMEGVAQAQRDVGKRTAKSAATEVREVGYDNQTTRGYLRAHGAKVAELKPKHNRRLRLRHLLKLQEKGWLIKAVIRFGPHNGKWGNHAVRVRKVITDPKTGDIISVHVYDSNVGRVLDVPAKRFQELLSEAAPNLEGLREGILTVFRFDSD